MFDKNNNNKAISPISSLLKKWACGCPIASQWCNVRLRSICVCATKRLSYSFLRSTNWSIIFLTTLLRFVWASKNVVSYWRRCFIFLLCCLHKESLHQIHLFNSISKAIICPSVSLGILFCPCPKPNLIRVVQMSRTFSQSVDMSCILYRQLCVYSIIFVFVSYFYNKGNLKCNSLYKICATYFYRLSK